MRHVTLHIPYNKSIVDTVRFLNNEIKECVGSVSGRAGIHNALGQMIDHLEHYHIPKNGNIIKWDASDADKLVIGEPNEVIPAFKYCAEP